jgi:uncharacterized protein (TIGR03086 family)
MPHSADATGAVKWSDRPKLAGGSRAKNRVVTEDRSHDVMQLIDAGRDREAARRGALSRDGGTMDPLSQLGRLAGPLGTVAAGITPDQLDRPTPCADFSVRGVLEHMIGGATAFAAAYRGEPPADPDLSDPLASFGPTLERLAAAMSAPGALDRRIAAPFGEVSGVTFARFVVLDGLVHGWDLATATGQAYDPPAELVAAAEATAREVLEPMRDGRTFAAAVEARAGASPIERLAAFTGRAAPVPVTR